MAGRGGRRPGTAKAVRCALLGTALTGLASGRAPAGEPGDSAPAPSPRRLEASWERPAACGPPPAASPEPGPDRRLETRSEPPACRLSEPGAEPRWWPPEGIWVETPWRPPPVPR